LVQLKKLVKLLASKFLINFCPSQWNNYAGISTLRVDIQHAVLNALPSS